MAAATDERLIYEILSAVGEIPEGNVATYGQIARLIGRPKNARLVGRVLSQAERPADDVTSALLHPDKVHTLRSVAR